MSIRLPRLVASLLIAAGALLVQAHTLPAEAQPPTPEKDDTCIACHESLYLLHDTGKWYCLCEVKARCTYCHGGVVGALDEETAHQGMVANPLGVDSETCQACHPADIERRVTVFAARAGLSPTPCPTVEALVASYAPPTAPVAPQGMAVWQTAALILLGVGLVGLAAFAYRCWKADCLRRPTSP